jgi:tripeptidyl-peptidase-1
MVRVVVLLSCVLCILAGRSFVELNVGHRLPPGWKREVPSYDAILPFTLVLNLKKAALEEKFWSVSDPKSPDYAKYLSIHEIADMFGPSTQQIAVIEKFLRSYGVSKIYVTTSRDFISFSAPVSVAQQIFQVKFENFTHATLPTVVRTLDTYTLPTEIAQLVSFVTGVHRFPTKPKLRVKLSGKHGKMDPQFGSITPQVIWSTFNTGGLQGSFSNNSQGVAQFLEQYFNPADLAAFQSQYNLPAQPAAKILGPNEVNNPGIEASLDIEYISGTAPNISTWFWSTGPPLHGGQEDFVRWAQDMNQASSVPSVMSVSYGDDESSIDKDWADRLNQEFQKVALRGVSILFASGDDGVGCSSSCRHLPNWPASSPFVTSVGGFVGTGQNTLIGDGISSGGFSNFYAMPSYQSNAVQSYLTNTHNLPPSSQYNASSRAMPDVSSFSENVLVLSGGELFPVGGTSCAAPVFSGIISLINDALLTAGKKHSWIFESSSVSNTSKCTSSLH